MVWLRRPAFHRLPVAGLERPWRETGFAGRVFVLGHLRFLHRQIRGLLRGSRNQLPFSPRRNLLRVLLLGPVLQGLFCLLVA